jgi:hypothetical protein
VFFVSIALCAPHTLLTIFTNANPPTKSHKRLLVSSIGFILRVLAFLEHYGLELDLFMPSWIDGFHWAWCYFTSL